MSLYISTIFRSIYKSLIFFGIRADPETFGRLEYLGAVAPQPPRILREVRGRDLRDLGLIFFPLRTSIM